MAGLNFDDLIPPSSGSSGLSFDDLIPKSPAEIGGDLAFGQIERGNLDGFNRPTLQNPDGSYSTSSSMSFGTDKGEVLVPTVVDGRRLSNDEAIARYRETGQHYGIFDTPENASTYAQYLHELQAEDQGRKQPALEAPPPIAPEPIPQSTIETGDGAPVFGEQTRLGEPSTTLTPAVRDGRPAQALMRGAENLKATGYGLVALGADAVGADKVGDWALQGYKNTSELAKALASDVPSYKDVHTVTDAGKYAVDAVFENIPMFLPSLVTGGVGAMVARKGAEKVVERIVAEKMAEGLTREMAEKAAGQVILKRVGMASAAGAAPSSIGMEAGSIYGDIVDETGKRGGAASAAAAVGGVAAGALDVLPEVMVLKKALGPIVDEFTGSLVKRFGKETAKLFVTEAGTEGLQTVIEQASVMPLAPGKKLNWDEVIDSALKGGIGGAAFGAGGQAVAEVRNAAKPSTEEQIYDEVAGTQFNPQGTARAAVAALDPNKAITEAEFRGFNQLPRAALTPEEIAGPLPNDILAEGKALMDSIAGGQPPPPLPVQPTASPVQPVAPAVQPGPTDEPQDFQLLPNAGPTAAPPPNPLAGAPAPGAAPPTAAPEPVASSAPAPTLRTDGKPFKTEAEARLASKSRNDLKGKGYQPVQVEGGWGLATPSTSETGETVRAAPTTAPVAGSSSPAAGEPTPSDGTAGESDHVPHTDRGPGTRHAPVKIESADDLKIIADRIHRAPSDGHKDAENYPAGHGTWNGMGLTFENFPGGVRRSKSTDDVQWEVPMTAFYGRIKDTEGADSTPEKKEQLDFYMGPNPKSTKVFVIDQYDAKTQSWDEHKNMFGYDTQAEAEASYDAHFSDGKGPQRRLDVTPMSIDQFNEWRKNGNTKLPAAGATTTKAPAPKAQTSKPLLRGDGNPFPTKQAARNASKLPSFVKANGRGWIPTEIEGGWGLKQRAPIVRGKNVGRTSPKGVLAWIASYTSADGRRGMNDDGGEISSRDALGTFVPGVGKPFSKTAGNDPDKVREAAIEAGYLPEGASVDDLYDLIDDELAGNTRYTAEESVAGKEADDTASGAYRDDLERAAADYGVDPTGKTDEQLVELLDAVRAQNEAADNFNSTDVAAIEEELRQADNQTDGQEDIPFEDTTGRQAVAGARAYGDEGGGRPDQVAEGPEGGAGAGEGGAQDAGRGGEAPSAVEPAAERTPTQKALDWIRSKSKLTTTDTIEITPESAAEGDIPPGTYEVKVYSYQGTVPGGMMTSLRKPGKDLVNDKYNHETLRLGDGSASGRNIVEYGRHEYTLKAEPAEKPRQVKGNQSPNGLPPATPKTADELLAQTNYTPGEPEPNVTAARLAEINKTLPPGYEFRDNGILGAIYKNGRYIGDISKTESALTREAEMRRRDDAEGKMVPASQQKPKAEAPAATDKAKTEKRRELMKAVSKATRLKGVAVTMRGGATYYDPLTRILNIGDNPGTDIEAIAALARGEAPTGWGETKVDVTLDDGTVEQVPARQVAQVLSDKIKRTASVLECLR